MSVISLRLNENEEKILKEISEFEGLGISSYIKKIIFENLSNLCHLCAILVSGNFHDTRESLIIKR